jgi:hypothetical protein
MIDTVSADAEPVSDYAGNRSQSVIDHAGPVSDHPNPVIDHKALTEAISRTKADIQLSPAMSAFSGHHEFRG